VTNHAPKRVLLVAATTGYQTAMFAEAASRAGIDLLLATDRCHVLEDPWHDRAIPIRFDHPDAAAQAVADSAARLDGILAVGDGPSYVASIIAARCGLAFHPPAAVEIARDKYLTRERFRLAGLPVPTFYRIPLSEPPKGARFYPCVVKPLGLSGSRGVIRAGDDAQFTAAVQRIRNILADPDLRRASPDQSGFLQVEEFIAGREFALEGIMTAGELHVLAIFDKPDPLDGPFFEETIYVTPSRESPSTQHAIEAATARAVRALGLTSGPVHAEMRVNPEGVWMLEVAARPIGGLCAKALPGLEEFLLHHAAGNAPPPVRLDGASAVMMIPIPRDGIFQDVDGIPDAAGVPGITEVAITAKQGQHIVPLPEGKSYLGFLFAHAESPAAAEYALRIAHEKLHFRIVSALPVV
jgi:biotin carboxylase